MAPRTYRKRAEPKAEASGKVDSGRVEKSRRSPENNAGKYANDRKKWINDDRLLVYKMRCEGKPYNEIAPLLQRSDQSLRLIVCHARETLDSLEELDDAALLLGVGSEDTRARRKAAKIRAAAFKANPALESAAEWNMNKKRMPKVKAKPAAKKRTRTAVPDLRKAPTTKLLPAAPQATLAPVQPVRQLVDHNVLSARFEVFHIAQLPPDMLSANGNDVGEWFRAHMSLANAVRSDRVFAPPHPVMLPPNPSGTGNAARRVDSSSPVNKMSISFLAQ
ncbi:hypothetical protein LTR78_003376 [Recurvomyces mirabilis]|uniref:Uncharacterized protein n=1 Tax=Recurvomyces mirabilis TaxID=574656 RepID=A0AAE0WRM8_9PEZI|nr:hypothetical protein LTR78_003376 [Recurvomyces mirabilis]KAK5154588.1 hypothetical protein LTS14_006726 [Recurvomyces mirabilis]